MANVRGKICNHNHREYSPKKIKNREESVMYKKTLKNREESVTYIVHQKYKPTNIFF